MQSIVSLITPLRHQLIKYTPTAVQNILTFVSTKNINVFVIFMFEILMNYVPPPVRVGRHIVFPLASVCLCVCRSVGLWVCLSVRHKIVSAL